ncbi:hypothetical protein TWF281_005516 [Arthrobotrys megalospora]
MPLRCPAGATRVAPTLSYTSSLSSRRIPLRICSSCRVRLSFRGLSTLSNRQRPTSLRYQLLAANLPSRSNKYGFQYPTISVARYATNIREASLPRKSNEALTPRLVILGTPAQRRGVDPLEAPDPMDKAQFDGLTQALQTFEFEVEDKEVSNEILLFKPESLRVSQSRFEQVVKELDAAFLGPQVKDYLGTTNLDIAGGVSKLRKKQALNLVMREVWGVKIDEEIAAEMDVVREKELKFERMHLFFMMMEGGDILQKLASRNRTRIILSSKANTVVLKGTKPRIERVEKQLRELPARIIHSEVDISPLLRVGNVTKTYIPSISRLTSVFLDIIDDKLTLHGLIPYGPRDILDAKRLLFNSTDLHIRQIYSLLGETRLTAPLTGALYPVAEDQALPWMYRGREWCRWRSIRTPKSNTADHVEENDFSLSGSSPLLNPARGDKVGYNDIRPLLDSFSTSSTAVDINASQNADATTDVDTKASTGSIDAATEEFEEPTPTVTAANPNIPSGAEIQTTYRAVLGQILHSSPTLPKTREPKSLSDLFASNPSHVLCNSVPKVLDFLSTLNPVTYKYDFKILLKFSPSPWKHPKNFELLPPVEMELQIKPDTNELQALKVGAVESHSIVDVLMPRNTCDLRFMKRTLARVEGKTDKVKEYIRKAKLDVLGQDRLEAGEELVFTLPSWMVKDAEKVSRLREKPIVQRKVEDSSVTFSTTDSIDDIPEPDEDPFDEDPLENIPVTYFFTGLETRSSTTFDFDGSPLVYTKVEGGASGGSYDEVVLECQKDEIEYLTPLEQETLGREDEIAEEKRKAEEIERLRSFEEKERATVEREQMARHQYWNKDIQDSVFSTGDPEEIKREQRREELERKLQREAEKREAEELEAQTADGEFGDSDGVVEEAGLARSEVTSESAGVLEIQGSEAPEAHLKELESELEGLETREEPEPGKQPTGLEFLYGEEEPGKALDASLSSDPALIEELPAAVVKEPKMDDEESDIISDTVFQRFVHRARKLVEAVENTEADHERVKPKKL